MPSNGAARPDIASISPSHKKLSADDRLVERVTVYSTPGCGEQRGYAGVEFRRLPSGFVLGGFPIFKMVDGELRIGMPRVLGAYPGARYTAISTREDRQLVAEVQAALLAQHLDLLERS